jgi:hypothetical protein
MKLFADPMRIGVAAEYASSAALLAAIAALRARGYVRLDTYTPTEIDGLDEHLAIPRSRIPLVALLAGGLGVAAGYLVQWYCNSVNYPLDVGGRPIHSAPAFVPITFETMILFAAVATTVALFAACRLPEVWNPLFEIDGFERATIDRYWLGVDERDAQFELGRTRQHLSATAPLRDVDVRAAGVQRGGAARRAALGVVLQAAWPSAGCERGQQPAVAFERMWVQRRADPYAPSSLFADGMAMRQPPAGAVPQSALRDPAAAAPGAPSRAQLRPPPTLLGERGRNLTAAQFLSVVSDGYGLMPSYAGALSVDDRWAVWAYVQVLQLRDGVALASLPADLQQRAAAALAATPAAAERGS